MTPPRSPSSCARRISAIAPSRSSRIGATISPAAPLRARLAQLGRPSVVRASAREEVRGTPRRDRVEPGAEGCEVRAGGRVGTREHHFAGDAVVVELLVACCRVPATAQADLVQAVALVVLAEPLLLELVVTGERVEPGGGASRVDERLALGELVVELGAVLRVEEVAVHRGVGPRVAVRRDDHVVLHGSPWAVPIGRAARRNDRTLTRNRAGVESRRPVHRSRSSGVRARMGPAPR